MPLCVTILCAAEGPRLSLQGFTYQGECSANVQVGQFEGIIQHCLSTPGVHVIDLPIDYAVSAHLQVSKLVWIYCLAIHSWLTRIRL